MSSQTPELLLAHHLKTLKLPTFGTVPNMGVTRRWLGLARKSWRH